MPTLNKLLECLSLLLTHLNGPVYMKYGFPIFISSSVDMETIQSESKGQDPCLKDCLKPALLNTSVSSITFMQNSRNNME